MCAQVSGDGGCGGWVAAGGKQKACRVSAGPHPVGDRTFAPLAPYSDILGHEAEDSWGLTGSRAEHLKWGQADGQPSIHPRVCARLSGAF